MDLLNSKNFRDHKSWIGFGYGAGTVGHSLELQWLEFSFNSRMDWYLKNSLYWELVNKSLWNKCNPLPTIVNKVSLEHGYVYLFAHCL